MKKALSFSPTFNPTARTLDFSGYSGFSLSKLYAVIDISQNQIIYAVGQPAYGYASLSGSLLTLAYNTTAFNSGDTLMVFYDESDSVKLLDGSGNPITSTSGALNIAGTIMSTNAANAATGSAVPLVATQVGGSDGTNLQALKVSSTGVLSVDGSAVTQPISASSLPLPSGAATAANQATANSSLSSIDSKLTSPLAVTGTFFQTTQPVSAASLPLPTGAATAANQATGNASLASIDGKLTSPLAVTGTFFQATQPVSAASLPLPSGAATAANQVTELSSLASILANQTNTTQKTQVTSIVPTSDVILSSSLTSLVSTISINVNGLAEAGINISGTFVGNIQAQGVPPGGGSPVNLSTLQSGIWTTNPITATGFYKARALPGYASMQVVFTSYTSGTAAVTIEGSSIVASPMVSQANAANLNATVVQSSGANLHVNVDNFPATQPVSAASLPLPSGASTDASITQSQGSVAPGTAGTKSTLIGGVFNTSLPTLTNGQQSAIQLDSSGRQIVMSPGIPTSLGQQSAANSQPVALANENVQDLYTIGQSAQTATVNNILTTTAGTAPLDLTGYRSGSVQIVSTGTAGTFIFEGSNDNVNFQTIPVYSQLILTGTPIVAAITATASSLIYTFPVPMRYIRVRIATAITGGSIQAFSKFSQTSWIPAIIQVAQGTAANLNVTVGSGTITTVSTVTSSNSAIPGIIQDVASAALTTTTTTATFTPTFGASYSVVIPVTAVSGTTPTLDVQIQESDDTGTNWVAIYDFPRIVTTGIYRSPVLPLTGNRIRYVQTVSGTTPSFTRSVQRLQSSLTLSTAYRQLIDRTIGINALSNTTPNLTIGNASRIMLSLNLGPATSAPVLQLQGSDDNAQTWYSIGGSLMGVANSTVSITTANVNSTLVRALVTTAGTSATLGYALLRAF